MDWVDLVKAGGVTIEEVPESECSAAVCLAAVQRNGYALEHVRDSMKTAAVCLAAVRQAGLALRYVPLNMRTPELSLEAVQRNPSALEYVLEPFKTKALCSMAIHSQYKRVLAEAKERGFGSNPDLDKLVEERRNIPGGLITEYQLILKGLVEIYINPLYTILQNVPWELREQLWDDDKNRPR